MTECTSKIKDSATSLLWKLPYEERRKIFKVFQPSIYRKLQNLRNTPSLETYSLLPFEENQCIFIHIPKCAGISVCQSLFGCLAGGHIDIKKYQIAFSKVEFESYFKFSFVRNPWDRVVSAFFFLKGGGRSKADKIWQEKILSKYSNFESFVKNWINQENIESWRHFRPQYKFLCEPGSTKLAVDFVGRFEILEESYAYVSNKLNLNNSLRRIGVGAGRERNYKEYYSDSTINIVANAYQRDIRLFGYDFENLSIKNRK